MSLNNPIHKRDAERLKTITMSIRMTAEATLAQFLLPGLPENDTYVRQSIFFWNATIKSLNWIDSLIDSRTRDKIDAADNYERLA